MRLLLDEDVPLPVLALLRHLLRDHTVEHVVNLANWTGKKDHNLYHDAAKRSYDIVVTNNKNQMNDPDECDAIKRSGIHWVGYRHRHQGLKGLAVAIASITAAMPSIVDELNQADGQRLVKITGIDPTQKRYECIDPRTDPPKYWRR